MRNKNITPNSLNTDSVKAVSFQTVKDCEVFGEVVARHWLDRRSLPMLDPALSMENALVIRDSFLKHLEPTVGLAAGYKVAAITPPAQRDLGIHEPLGAIYLKGMFSKTSDIAISVAYGVRPIVEAKMMAVIGDSDINDVTTPGAALTAISHLNPSIELGDSLSHPTQKITGAVLTAYNVGARSVLTGPLISFSGDDAAQRFERMIVSTIEIGPPARQIEKLSADAMMGSPANAIYWIINHYRQKGVVFKKGDRLGLGAMSRVRPVRGQSIKTVWEGLLPEPIEMGVSFK